MFEKYVMIETLSDLNAMPSAPRPMLQTLCAMPHALSSKPSAPFPMRSALCAVLFAGQYRQRIDNTGRQV